MGKWNSRQGGHIHLYTPLRLAPSSRGKVCGLSGVCTRCTRPAGYPSRGGVSPTAVMQLRSYLLEVDARGVHGCRWR
jgi:hypothetical protein